MADLHGRIFLFAIQKIFFSRPRIACEIIKDAGSAGAVFDGDRGRFRSHFGNEKALWERFRKFDDWNEVESDLKKSGSLGLSILGLDDDQYPKLLKEIHDPPPVLYAKGLGIELLNAPAVAIVGSRKAGERGRVLAAEIAEYLSERGIAVVSGMAYGIDAAAHRGALHGGTGTIAVMGCGPDVVYPPGHADLARRIAESGLILSEFPLGTDPYASNFPQRNRIISGMSIAVVIVEAAAKSGSLITARFALEQGREVMACPGMAGLHSHRGVNGLIRDGAHLVESGEEVFDIIASRLPADILIKRAGHFEVDVDKDSPLLLAMRGRKALSVDEIIAASGMGAKDVLEALTRLLIAAAVVELPGRRFRLKGA